jgi:hypothetical protein
MRERSVLLWLSRSQNWRNRYAPGIAAAAWRTTDLQVADLQGPPYAHTTEDGWNALLRDKDPRTFRRLWSEISVTRKCFAAILAAPIMTESGKAVGVISMNIDSEVMKGLAKLEAAGILAILKRTHADAGHFVLV